MAVASPYFHSRSDKVKSEYKRVAVQTGHSLEFAAKIEAELKKKKELWPYEEFEAYKIGLYAGLKLAESQYVSREGCRLVPIYMTPEMVTAFFYSDIFQGAHTESAVRACWAETVAAAPGVDAKEVLDHYCAEAKKYRAGKKQKLRDISPREGIRIATKCPDCESLGHVCPFHGGKPHGDIPRE